MRVEARDIGLGVLAGSEALLAGALASHVLEGRFFAYPFFQAGLSLGVASVVVYICAREKPLKKQPRLIKKPIDDFWNGEDSLAVRYRILSDNHRIEAPSGTWHRVVEPWFWRFNELCIKGKLVPFAYLDGFERDVYYGWLFCGRNIFPESKAYFKLWNQLKSWGQSTCPSALSDRLTPRQQLAVKLFCLDNLLRRLDGSTRVDSKWLPMTPVESFAAIVASLRVRKWSWLPSIVNGASIDQRCRFERELGRLLAEHWGVERYRPFVAPQYACAIASFDLPLPLDRLIAVVNALHPRSWQRDEKALLNRWNSAKTYHQEAKLPRRAKRLIEKMWGGKVPTCEDLEGAVCPRIQKSGESGPY